jgi:hypothetical protein
VSGWFGQKWSLEEVKALLGHRSITTTERYAHLGETALKEAARRSNGGNFGGGNMRNLSVVRSVPKPKVARPIRAGGTGKQGEFDSLVDRVDRAWTWLHDVATLSEVDVDAFLLDVVEASAADGEAAREALRAGAFKLDRAIELAERIVTRALKLGIGRTSGGSR